MNVAVIAMSQLIVRSSVRRRWPDPWIGASAGGWSGLHREPCVHERAAADRSSPATPGGVSVALDADAAPAACGRARRAARTGAGDERLCDVRLTRRYRLRRLCSPRAGDRSTPVSNSALGRSATRACRRSFGPRMDAYHSLTAVRRRGGAEPCRLVVSSRLSTLAGVYRPCAGAALLKTALFGTSVALRRSLRIARSARILEGCSANACSRSQLPRDSATSSTLSPRAGRIGSGETVYFGDRPVRVLFDSDWRASTHLHDPRTGLDAGVARSRTSWGRGKSFSWASIGSTTEGHPVALGRD